MATEWATIQVYRDRYGHLTAGSVSLDPENFAHGVWTALATTLAEPLRKAFNDHCDEHGCGCPGGKFCENPEGHESTDGHQVAGVAHCVEGSRLFSLLPDGDRIIYA